MSTQDSRSTFSTNYNNPPPRRAIERRAIEKLGFEASSTANHTGLKSGDRLALIKAPPPFQCHVNQDGDFSNALLRDGRCQTTVSGCLAVEPRLETRTLLGWEGCRFRLDGTDNRCPLCPNNERIHATRGAVSFEEVKHRHDLPSSTCVEWNLSSWLVARPDFRIFFSVKRR